MTNRTLGCGRDLRHDTPVTKRRVSNGRFYFPEKVVRSLIAKQVPAGSGRRLHPHRWGFVADPTPVQSCEIDGCVLLVSFTRRRTLVG